MIQMIINYIIISMILFIIKYYMKLFNYNTYVFDLDGTIINSEPCHYLAYNNFIKTLSYNEYQKIFHSELRHKYIIENNINKTLKENIFYDNYIPEYVQGFEMFFNKLIELGKNIIIVTNSSMERINFIKSKHPLLNKIDKWYVNSPKLSSKPHSDNYIKALTETGESLKDIIIFLETGDPYIETYKSE